MRRCGGGRIRHREQLFGDGPRHRAGTGDGAAADATGSRCGSSAGKRRSPGPRGGLHALGHGAQRRRRGPAAATTLRCLPARSMRRSRQTTIRSWRLAQRGGVGRVVAQPPAGPSQVELAAPSNAGSVLLRRLRATRSPESPKRRTTARRRCWLPYRNSIPRCRGRRTPAPALPRTGRIWWTVVLDTRTTVSPVNGEVFRVVVATVRNARGYDRGPYDAARLPFNGRVPSRGPCNVQVHTRRVLSRHPL